MPGLTDRQHLRASEVMSKILSFARSRLRGDELSASTGRPAESRPILLLSTADWDATLWTNKQHTARSLRDQGAKILYVESVGLRVPSLSSADRNRIVRRLARAARMPDEVEPGIWRWSPLAIPLHRYRVVRYLNYAVLSALLRFWTRLILGDRPIVWTYNPLTTALFSLPKFEKLAYHCVDDMSAQPGIPASAIEKYEKELVHIADHVFVTSRALQEKWSALRPVQYDPNCVDVGHFQPGPDSERKSRDPLAAVPHPRLGFVGAVASYKLDVDLLDTLTANHPEWSIVIIGPREDDDARLSRVLARSNVHYMGPVEYKNLPSFMHSLDVGLIPARSSQYAKSMFPMKFFEYMAAGLPVVATDLPALADFKCAASVVPPAEFGDAITAALDGVVPSLAAREDALLPNTYAARTRRMLTTIDRGEIIVAEPGSA